MQYASGATVQIILFATLAIELKRRAPNAHTFLEVIRARYGAAPLYPFSPTRDILIRCRPPDTLCLHLLRAVYQHPRYGYALDRWLCRSHLLDWDAYRCGLFPPASRCRYIYYVWRVRGKTRVYDARLTHHSIKATFLTDYVSPTVIPTRASSDWLRYIPWLYSS